MSSLLRLPFANLVSAWLPLAVGHVYMFEPPTRNIIASDAGNEQCPHCLQAGGPDAVKTRGGGVPVWPTMLKPESHGLCGDPVQNSPEPTSIQEEKYMEPTAVQRTYTAGSTVEFRVGISTHHWGHYEVRLCDRKLDKSLSSKQDGQNCLNEHVLHRAPRSASCGSATSGDCQYNNPKYPGRWYLPPPGASQEKDERGNEVHTMKYVIPAGVTCEECTLQWYYVTGNTCAYDEDYLSFDPGFKYWNHYKASWTTKDNAVCGPSGNGKYGEEFWNCADVKVVGTSGRSSDILVSSTCRRIPSCFLLLMVAFIVATIYH